MQLVDARGVAKNRLYGNRSMVTLMKTLFNPNSGENLLAEDQINCYGVKVYYRPRVLGGKQLVKARYQVGRSVKLGISWDGSTRYLDVILPTREDVKSLGSFEAHLQITVFTIKSL